MNCHQLDDTVLVPAVRMQENSLRIWARSLVKLVEVVVASVSEISTFYHLCFHRTPRR
jgi:hypothetical protein